MAPRGRISKKKGKKKDVYRGFPQGFTLKQDSTSAAIEDSDSDGPVKEVPANSVYLSLPKGQVLLPKCPSPGRMFNWSVSDYQQYDQYLIEKWSKYGFSANETVYMSMRDQNSRLAQVYRSIWMSVNEKKP